jgi:D-3-phosphoglycerate dehydrogenase
MTILLTDVFSPWLLGQLEARYRVAYYPTVNAWADLPDALRAETEALVVRTRTRVDAQALTHLPSLRKIVRAGAGLDHIDLQACATRGIEVVATPGGNREAVGDHTVGLMLAVLNRLVPADRALRQLRWEREANRGLELGTRTVGIIGYGQTGSAVAQRLTGFGCRILAYDKYKTGFGSPEVTETDLATLQQEADIISFHVPLTPETRGWVGQEFIARVARPFWLFNLSRGGIVVWPDVVAALESGRLRGAGLDVFENEDFSTLTPEQKQILDRLAVLDTVVLTPHLGGVTHESAHRIEVQVLHHLGVVPE